MWSLRSCWRDPMVCVHFRGLGPHIRSMSRTDPWCCSDCAATVLCTYVLCLCAEWSTLHCALILIRARYLGGAVPKLGFQVSTALWVRKAPAAFVVVRQLRHHYDASLWTIPHFFSSPVPPRPSPHAPCYKLGTTWCQWCGMLIGACNPRPCPISRLLTRA